MVKNSKKHMHKRGEVAVGTLVIVGLVVLGGFIFSAEKIVSENRFIGDVKSNLYYDLKTCETSHLDKSNIRSFKNEQEAKNNGFKPAPCVK